MKNQESEYNLLEVNANQSPPNLREKKLPLSQMHSEHNQEHKMHDICGYMTLQEVAEKYDIPTNYLQKHLNEMK